MAEKYQREIEEILNQIGDEAFSDPPPPRYKEQSRLRALLSSIIPNGWKMSWLVVASLFISCMVVSATVPGMIGPILWLGLIVFLVVYTKAFSNSRHKEEKRWRGRIIDD